MRLLSHIYWIFRGCSALFSACAISAAQSIFPSSFLGMYTSEFSEAEFSDMSVLSVSGDWPVSVLFDILLDNTMHSNRLKGRYIPYSIRSKQG